MSNTTRRAVLYCRISESDESSTSLARQEDLLRQQAHARGWTVVEPPLIDDGLSGRKSRANSDRALAMLRSGEADVLAVFKFDRWSREGLGAVARLLDVLKAREESRSPALFYAHEDGLRSDQPAFDIIASVLASVAKMEAENTALRVRSFQRDAKRRGAWHGGMIPLGYESVPHPDGQGRALAPEPTESALLTEAAERIVGGSASFYAVAGWLNSTPFRPRKAARWSPQAVQRALTGTAIVGRVAMDGDVLRDADGLPREVWEPAIPVDLWRAVRTSHAARRLGVAKVGARAPMDGEKREARLLAGLVRCADCMAPLYSRRGSQGKGKPGKRLYSCSTRSNGGDCRGASVTADLIEAHVEAAYLEAFGAFEVVEPVEIDAPATALVEAEEALAEVTRRLDDLDLADDAETRLLGQRRTLRARVRELRADAQHAAPTIIGRPTGQRIAAAYAAAPTGTRRDLLCGPIEAVLISKGRKGAHGLDPARVEIVWRGDHDERIDVDPDEGESRGPSGGPRRAPRAQRPAE